MLSASQLAAAPSMNPGEQQFFKDLGARLAAARKSRVCRSRRSPTSSASPSKRLPQYAVGRARPPVSMVVQMARTLHVGVEELLGEPVRAAGKRGPAPKLQQQMERIAQLPRAKQPLVIQMLEDVLAGTSH